MSKIPEPALSSRPDYGDRPVWLTLSDEDLSRQCRLDAYQASGPGGQKRNRKYSAVRLAHLPSGLAVERHERRERQRNLQAALRALRLCLAVRTSGGKIDVPADPAPGPNSGAYPLWLAMVFDRLWETDFHVAPAAAALGLSTAKLVKDLARDPFAWRELSEARVRRALPALRTP